MGFFSKDIKTLDDLCRRALGELYYAEKRMVKVLPTFAAKAGDPLLKREFDSYLATSRRHLVEIEDVCKRDGEIVCALECPAMDGILIEAEELYGEIGDAKVLDTVLAATARTTLGFTAGRYATVAAWLFETPRLECARTLLHSAEEQNRAIRGLARLSDRLNARAGGRIVMDLAG